MKLLMNTGLEVDQEVQTLFEYLKGQKLPLQSEAELQKAILKFLPEAQPEYRLDPKSRIDFFVNGIGIEVKIKGQARAIYKQCERYCGFDQIQALVIVTNRSMGFPKEMCGKPIFVFKLGTAWL